MKLNELIGSFEIYTTNEEKKLLDSISSPVHYNSFDERDKIIIENLVRKSLISKIRHNNQLMIVKNEY